MYPATFGTLLYHLSDLTVSHKCFVWMTNLFLFPIDGNFFTFTRHEPIGVCGQIIPVSWNHLCKHKCSLLQMKMLLKFCLCKSICETLLIRNFQVLKDRDYNEWCNSNSLVCDESLWSNLVAFLPVYGEKINLKIWLMK